MLRGLELASIASGNRSAGGHSKSRSGLLTHTLVPEPPTNYDYNVTEGVVCQTVAFVVSPAEALA